MVRHTLGIPWQADLKFRVGSPTRLAGVHIFHDFNWYHEFGHDFTTFKNGQKLAERLRNECPHGKEPTLLLTTCDGPDFRTHESDHRYIYIVHIKRYLLLAKSDPALTFCANAANTKLSDLVALDATLLSISERKALIQRVITQESLHQLATENAELGDLVTNVARQLSPADEDTTQTDQLLRLINSAEAVDEDTIAATTGLINRIILGDVKSETHPVIFAANLIQTCVSHLGVSKTIEYMSNNELRQADLELAVELRSRTHALEQFATAMDSDLAESYWQKWFERNPWVLGSDCVQVLEARDIDTANIADFLVKAYDGHVDIIEIKRPSAQFWAPAKDHDNWVPHSDLVKALTQAQNYQFELEREMNSDKFLDRTRRIPIAKPKALLIHGRSKNWDAGKYRAQRLLNGSLSSVTVLTYDEVLTRANKIMARKSKPSDSQPEEPEREFMDFEAQEPDDEED